MWAGKIAFPESFFDVTPTGPAAMFGTFEAPEGGTDRCWG